jgi:hypothetical protein
LLSIAPTIKHILARCEARIHGGVCLTGGQIIMFGIESWGYGGYGQIHMIIWILIAAAAAAGFMWRLTR